MKNVICSLAALFFCVNIFAHSADSTRTEAKEKIYHVNRPIVAAIIGVGLFSDYFAIGRIKNKPGIDSTEIANLNISILDPIDRWALHQPTGNYKQFETLSDYGQIPLILLPGILALNKKIRKDWGDLLLMYAEGHTITFSVYNYSFLGPTFENKYRPFTYYSQFPLNERESGNDRNSFYSGHTASSAYSTFFLAKVWCDYHPDMGAEKYLWYTAASIPPLIIGYCRVRGLQHFPSDVATGFAVGSLLGIVIPEIHKIRNQNISLGMFTSPDGMGLNIRWTLSHQPRSGS